MKTSLTRQLFAELYAKGVPIREITETLGISPRTVDYWRARLRLPRRRKA